MTHMQSTITAATVHALFVEVNREHRHFPVPESTAWQRLADVLNEIRRGPPDKVTIMDFSHPVFEQAKTELALQAGIIDIYAPPPRPDFLDIARRVADQVHGGLAWLQQNSAPAEAQIAHTWHADAKRIEHCARAAWRTTGKVPRGYSADGPMVKFVVLALAAIGQHHSPAAVRAALEGWRGPGSKSREPGSKEKVTNATKEI